MKRFSEDHFKSWLQNPARKPMIIRGARQVGKSTLVRQVAKANGLKLIEVNLERHPELRTVFKTMDPGRILKEIELTIHTGPITNINTLLFFDEIQAVPDAIAALRYFYEERPDLPVVAAGSLLEFTLADHTFSMPVGRLEYYFLGPMTFGEFLSAQGHDDLENYLRTYRTPADASQSAHEQLIGHLRDFLFTGGMPEAVQSFARDNDPFKVREIHLSILNTYRDDFSKYAAKNELERLRRVFDYIPAAISRKFIHAQVNREWKAKDVRSAVDLLTQAGVIHRVHHVSGVGIPLGASIRDTIFKPLFLDVGLMNTACGSAPQTLEQIQSQRFIHEGPIAEQFIGQHLLYGTSTQSKPALFYWLREGKGANAEVDYVLQVGISVVPIEVKSGASGTLRSLYQFIASYGTPLAVRFDMNPPATQRIEQGTVITAQGKKEISFSLMSLPLYMAEYVPAMPIVP